MDTTCPKKWSWRSRVEIFAFPNLEKGGFVRRSGNSRGVSGAGAGRAVPDDAPALPGPAFEGIFCSRRKVSFLGDQKKRSDAQGRHNTISFGEGIPNT